MSDLRRAIELNGSDFDKDEAGNFIWEVGSSDFLIFQAAKERLRLSKVPCDYCKGKGFDVVASTRGPYETDEIPCPACDGAGEVWPAELVEVAAKAVFLDMARPHDIIDAESWEQFERGRPMWELHARAVLDAVESWMEAK